MAMSVKESLVESKATYAQDMLGHADASVTMSIYTHLSAQKKAKAVAALNQHITESITPLISQA